MKILISSLQVSTDGSKGHFNPAFELALACKEKSHRPILLPVPHAFSESDQRLLKAAGIEYLTPKILSESCIKTPKELALLASDSKNAWLAYYSFLIAPLSEQFGDIVEILKRVSPDVVVYDMLAYGPSLAARKLAIPDIGFCAGLKLIAPEHLLGQYKSYREKLNASLSAFLAAISIQAQFRYLELLSDFGQMVFTLPSLISDQSFIPKKTHLIGPLPISAQRQTNCAKIDDFVNDDDVAILSFGSVLDPADFPKLTQVIFECMRVCGLFLLVSSKQLSQRSVILPSHVKAYPYLPLPELLPKAKIFIHHGGANSFSEALRLGTPQLLIPLTNDQPIQAHYLTCSGAGISISPEDVSISKLVKMVRLLTDTKNPMHKLMADMAHQFNHSLGASRAVALCERIVNRHRMVHNECF